MAALAPRRTMSPRGGSDGGQATVEVAVLLPVLVLIIAAIAWVAQIGREQVALTNGARAAGRLAAIDTEEAVLRAALQQVTGLDASRLDLSISTQGDVVKVRVTYRSSARIPLLGATVADRTLIAESFFLREPPPP